jgi:2-methylcitrate dehydratase PrpD
VHVVPAAFAVAQWRAHHRGEPVSGAELIAAVTLAHDLMIRLSLACRTPPILQGRPGTYVFGTFATAAVTARLLRLDTAQTADALGNAYTRSAGTTLGYREGALAQRAMQGLSASAGVFAALLAANGIGGIRECLEGEGGYYTVHERGEYDRTVLLDGLGVRFHGRDTALKSYPVHRGAILDLEVALALRRSHTFDATQIERVEVHYPARFASGYARIGAFAPERAHPLGAVEPHFSSSWAVAVALAHGAVSIDDFTEGGVARLAETIVPLARRVEGVADPALDVDCRGLGAREIVVVQRDGTVLRERIDHAPGSAEQPLSWDALVAKLDDGARRAARSLDPERLRSVVDAIAQLESVADVGVIADALG